MIITVTTAEINERRAQEIARWDGREWAGMSESERRAYRDQAALMPGDGGWDPYAGSPRQKPVRPASTEPRGQHADDS